jgi:hypothetical protein
MKKILIFALFITVVAFSYKVFFASSSLTEDDTLAENRTRMRSRQSHRTEPRDYWAEITEEEKKEISYIITTLSTTSFIALALKEDSLKEAGDKVEHVHPLKFLRYIFMDPQLKQAVKKIQGTVWKRFSRDTARSLKQEAKLDNIKEPYLKDYSDSIGVDQKILQPSIQNKDWVEFINMSRDHLPAN